MASVKDIISDWSTDEGERLVLADQVPGLVIRWLNQAQLRFSEISQVLTGVWEPTIDSTGEETLPDDWLREVPDRVLWQTSIGLTKGDYATLKIANLSNPQAYAIWQGKFYVFGPTAGTPTIPYYKKPSEVKTTQYSTASLEIPSEYHHHLILFMDAMFARRSKDYKGYLILRKEFDQSARDAGIDFSNRRELMIMRGGMI